MSRHKTLLLDYLYCQAKAVISEEQIRYAYEKKQSFEAWTKDGFLLQGLQEAGLSLPQTREELLRDIKLSFEALADFLCKRSIYSDGEKEKLINQLNDTPDENVALLQPRLQPLIDEYASMLMGRSGLEFPPRLQGDFLPVASIKNERPDTEYFVMIRPPEAFSLPLLFQWETLRRAIELHGGRTIVEDTSHLEDSVRQYSSYPYARDILLEHKGVRSSPHIPNR